MNRILESSRSSLRGLAEVIKTGARSAGEIRRREIHETYSTLNDPCEVPVQVAAYRLLRDRYIRPRDRILDVGFGLGYGLRIMHGPSTELMGIEVDRAAVERARRLFRNESWAKAFQEYDGYAIPFRDHSFDVVACVDVLEHVPDYERLLRELVRVSRRVVLVSTPNRRPEYTNEDGSPKNFWHLREWSHEELRTVVSGISGVRVKWHFINGPWEGPFDVEQGLMPNTLALAPVLVRGNLAPD